jgi:hypothetical protein
VGSLNYEIESWNTNGTCYVWVQVPTIATDGTTTIWAWWGNPAESNRLACTTNGATWETSYRGVWHFGEGFGTTFADSTANNHPGTLQGSPLPAWTNMNGNGALLLPGNSGYADFAANAIPGDASGTILYFADRSVANSLCVDGGGASSDPTMRFGSGIIQAWKNPGGVNDAYNVSSVPGGWHLWAVESSGSAWTAYVNGVLSNLTQLANNNSGKWFSWVTGTRYSSLGRFRDGNTYYSSFGINELRVDSQQRSTNWLWAVYQNMANNSAFQTYGPSLTTRQQGTVFFFR